MRLPAHYEVIDAELAAILMVLKEVSERAYAGRRRILVMSDYVSYERVKDGRESMEGTTKARLRNEE